MFLAWSDADAKPQRTRRAAVRRYVSDKTQRSTRVAHYGNSTWYNPGRLDEMTCDTAL